MSILVDSFAWLELFKGSKKGRRTLQIFKENTGSIYTSVLNLYEIRYRIEEIKSAKIADDFVNTVGSHAKVMGINKEIAVEASKIKLAMREMGAVDCNILASARVNNLKVLTGDSHFKGLKEVIML